MLVSAYGLGVVVGKEPLVGLMAVLSVDEFRIRLIVFYFFAIFSGILVFWFSF